MNSRWTNLVLAGSLALFTCGQLASQEKILIEGQLDGKYPIKMLIYRDGNTVRGNYFYRKVGTLIRLGGTITASGVTDLQEWDGNGNQTGSFSGRLAKDHSFTGQWISPKGKALSAVLVPSKESDDEFFPSSVEYSLTAFSGIQQIQTLRITGGNAQVEQDLNDLLSVSRQSGANRRKK